MKKLYTVRVDFFDSGEFFSEIGPEEGVDITPELARSFLYQVCDLIFQLVMEERNAEDETIH